jgi:hypothetical protein
MDTPGRGEQDFRGGDEAEETSSESAEEEEGDPYIDDHPAVDLSVEPATMLAIRNSVRFELVKQVHAHRIAARVNRKVGNRAKAREHELEAEKAIRMIAALQDPMAPPEDWETTKD